MQNQNLEASLNQWPGEALTNLTAYTGFFVGVIEGSDFTLGETLRYAFLAAPLGAGMLTLGFSERYAGEILSSIEGSYAKTKAYTQVMAGAVGVELASLGYGYTLGGLLRNLPS